LPEAMSMLPCNRYASARDLADEIERWLADESISAAPETIPQRLLRLGRKHRMAVRAAVVAIVLFAIGATVAGFLVDAQRQEKSRLADENWQLAQTAHGETEKAKHLASEMMAIAEEKSRLAHSEKLAREQTARQFRIADAERLAAKSRIARGDFPVGDRRGRSDDVSRRARAAASPRGVVRIAGRIARPGASWL
jgi:uncharacterized protein HemX